MMRERRFERGLFGLGDGLALVAGLVLAVSSFTGWYTGPGEGVTVSVLGLAHGRRSASSSSSSGSRSCSSSSLREIGVEMPAALPRAS